MGGNFYDYGFRIYNPQIARFLSVDPLTKDYPELTPYQFASNTPIESVDLDGLESMGNRQYNFGLTVGQNYQQAANDRTVRSSIGQIGSNFGLGINFGLSQRFQLEPNLSRTTVAGVRDVTGGTLRNGRMTGVWAVRFDGPGGGTPTPHLNYNARQLTNMPPGAPTVDPHTPISQGTFRAAGNVQRGLTSFNRIAIPLAIASDITRIGDAVESDLAQTGSLGQNTVETAAGVAGSWAGAWVGATVGAEVGAMAGTAVAPGPGTAIGGLVGGVVGGVAGAIAGEEAAREAAGAVSRHINAAAEGYGKVLESNPDLYRGPKY
jgi:hypothetical protein